MRRALWPGGRINYKFLYSLISAKEKLLRPKGLCKLLLLRKCAWRMAKIIHIAAVNYVLVTYGLKSKLFLFLVAPSCTLATKRKQILVFDRVLGLITYRGLPGLVKFNENVSDGLIVFNEFIRKTNFRIQKKRK